MKTDRRPAYLLYPASTNVSRRRSASRLALLFSIFYSMLAATTLAARLAVAGELRKPLQLDRARLFEIVGSIYRIDPALLAAIAVAESGGSADAVSPKGAAGLMQLMPQTARHFHIEDPSDPLESALGAARFIQSLKLQHSVEGRRLDRLADILAAYNAGPATVQRYQGMPPFGETRQYVRRVLLLYLLGNLMRGSQPAAPGDAAAQPLRRPLPSTSRPVAEFETPLSVQLSDIRSARDHLAATQTRLYGSLPGVPPGSSDDSAYDRPRGLDAH